MPTDISGKASFSRCKNYRYSLTRQWEDSADTITLIGLNPSTADGRCNDATIRRCIGLTKFWGFGGFEIVNLFAYRTPSPKCLLKARDPVGPRNSYYVRRAIDRSTSVLLMWGNHGSVNNQDKLLLKTLRGADCFCAGITKSGAPRHLLYVKSNKALEPFDLERINKSG